MGHIRAQTTKQADPDEMCDCCGRYHRKLYQVDAYWLGANCKRDYELYKRWPSISTVCWKGWERQHAKVSAMVGALRN